MQTSFKNTINSKGAQLCIYNTNAKAQESEILKIFKRDPARKWRTIDIENELYRNFNSMNHDSVKRAITNLCNDNKLERSEKACVMGPHGKMVNNWWLKSDEAKQ